MMQLPTIQVSAPPVLQIEVARYYTMINAHEAQNNFRKIVYIKLYKKKHIKEYMHTHVISVGLTKKKFSLHCEFLMPYRTTVLPDIAQYVPPAVHPCKQLF